MTDQPMSGVDVGADGPGSVNADGAERRRVGRRHLIIGAAAAGAGMAAGLVAGADPAEAANGAAVLLGKTNRATAKTEITTTVGNAVVGWTSATGQCGVVGVDASATSGGQGVLGRSTHGSGTCGRTLADGNFGVEGVDESTGGGSGVYGTTTTGVGVWGTSPANGKSGVLGTDTSSTGGYGVQGTSTAGTGVSGESTDSDGVHGQTSGNGASGVYGYDDSPDGGYGVNGQSMNGTGVTGVGDEIGVLGTASSGEAYGGVLGLLGATTPPGAGVPILGAVTGYALLDQLAQTGVIGYSTNGTGVYGETDDGFDFGTVAVSAFDGSAKGAYGLYTTSTKGKAVYASGNVTVTGALSKGGGSFRIDHPLDPANKYLYHSFVESPEMMNVYSGNVVLDDQGQATVELPDWFEALNKEFRYQLTAVGGAAPNLHIARKVGGGSFDIAGGNPGAEVSWMVTGIRQDAWADANRIPVEVDKPAEDRGRYLHPELFGPDARPVSELFRPNLHRPRLGRRDPQMSE